MKNVLTFSGIVSILLKHKKKTYPQHQLIRDMFSLCIEKNAPTAADQMVSDNTMFSRWCSGERPVPLFIAEYYDTERGHQEMKNAFQSDIFPELLNLPKARKEAEELARECIPLIGEEKYKEWTEEKNNEDFFTDLILYAILTPGEKSEFRSPDLVNRLLSNHVPAPMKIFIGRGSELKECHAMLIKERIVFVSGVAGIGKSEFIKKYAAQFQKKYRNILYFFYTGSLQDSITKMIFSSDQAEWSEEKRFQAHWDSFRDLEADTLVILDGFDVPPEEEPLLTDFAQLSFRLLVSTRCRQDRYSSLELAPLQGADEMRSLFAAYCSFSPEEESTVDQIIQTVHGHTMTIILAALTMKAVGFTSEELLAELKKSSFDIPEQEEVELYKDGLWQEDILRLHLRKLLRLHHFTDAQKYILQCISLFPLYGIRKRKLKRLLDLDSLKQVTRLIKLGFLQMNPDGSIVSMHPLIREIIAVELCPTLTSCAPLIVSLRKLCMLYQAGVPESGARQTIELMISVLERVAIDDPQEYLYYMQDLFNYLEDSDWYRYIPKLADRMEFVLNSYHLHTPADDAVLMDIRAAIAAKNHDHRKALQLRLAAISMLKKPDCGLSDPKTFILLSNLYNNLSLTYNSLKDPEKAQAALRQAMRFHLNNPQLQTDPGVFPQLYNLFFLALKNNDCESAATVLAYTKEHVEFFYKNQPGALGRYYYMAGCMHYKQQDWTRSEECFLEAQRLLSAASDLESDVLQAIPRYLLLISFQKKIGQVPMHEKVQ